ncbi:MAG: hypothetical protein QM582_07645 [Micropruina sp.]|uniref:hypothetical protein n=1 Tax=Micropruina sp. TaxID=2737536 RepID=UPI0039E41D96
MIPQPEPVVDGGDPVRRSVPALWIVLAAIVLLLGGSWLAGGFQPATGRLARLPADTEVDLGPISVSMTSALARENLTNSWSVYVFGRCRNNGDEPLVSSRDRLVRNAFSMQHPVDRAVTGDGSLFFGPGETLGNSTVLNPGTPMVPCTLVFTPDAFPDTDTISVGASVLEWIDASPTGEGEMVWSAGRTGYRFELPVVTERAAR